MNKLIINLSVIVFATISIAYLSSCEKKDIPNYDRKDYAIIEVLHLGKTVAHVGAIPDDSVRFGEYTIIYTKRK